MRIIEQPMNKTRLAIYLTLCILLFVFALILCIKYRDPTFSIFAIPLFAMMMRLS